MARKSRVHDLEKEFIVLSPDKAAVTETADASLYQRIEQNYDGFKGHELISVHQFEQDWSMWEMHPEGDEVVILLSGEVIMELQLDSGRESVSLKQPGSCVVVPRGVWHTAKTRIKTRLLFVTPGEGTRNRASPE